VKNGRRPKQDVTGSSTVPENLPVSLTVPHDTWAPVPISQLYPQVTEMFGMRPLALALRVRADPFSVTMMLPVFGPVPPQTSVLLLTTTPAVAGEAAQTMIGSARIAYLRS